MTKWFRASMVGVVSMLVAVIVAVPRENVRAGIPVQEKEAPKSDAEILRLLKPGELAIAILLKEKIPDSIKAGDRVNVAATTRVQNQTQTRYIVTDVELLGVGLENKANPKDPTTRVLLKTSVPQALIIKAYQETATLSLDKRPTSKTALIDLLDELSQAKKRLKEIDKEFESLQKKYEALLVVPPDAIEQMKNAEAKLRVEGQRGSNDDKTEVAGKVEIRRAETTPADGLTEAIDPKENRKIYLHKKVELDNKDVASARYESEPVLEQHAVVVTFTADGAEKMGKLTKQMVGKRLAILLDGRVISVLTIELELSKGAMISGMKKEDAEKLVKALNAK